MKDKTGMNLYYDYLDNEFAELSLEEIGALCIGALSFDCGQELRPDAVEVISRDRMMKTLYKTICGKTKRATGKWYEMQERLTKSAIIREIMEEEKVSKEEAETLYKQRYEKANPEKTEKAKMDIPIPEPPKKEVKMLREWFSFDDDKKVIVEYAEDKKANIPTVKDITDAQQEQTDDFIIEVLNLGNKRKWETDFWDLYDELAFLKFTEQNTPPEPVTEEPQTETEEQINTQEETEDEFPFSV